MSIIFKKKQYIFIKDYEYTVNHDIRASKNKNPKNKYFQNKSLPYFKFLFLQLRKSFFYEGKLFSKFYIIFIFQDKFEKGKIFFGVE